MKPLLSQAEYTKSLPKKRMGVCVLFFDEAGKLLIVKPNYREGWSVPGGVVDAEESPKESAIRETKEEIGLEIEDMKFLAVEHVSTVGESTEGIEFVFLGGTLSEDDVSRMVMEKEEFDALQFVELPDALPLLRESIKQRVLIGLEVMKTGVPVYSDVQRRS